MRILVSGLLLAMGLAATASAQTVNGTYSVAGTNADGTAYKGTAEITWNGHSLLDQLADRLQLRRHLPAHRQGLWRFLSAGRRDRHRRLRASAGWNAERPMDDSRHQWHRYGDAVSEQMTGRGDGDALQMA